MSSGINRIAVGSLICANPAVAVNIDTVGFRPKLVRVVNVGATGKSRLEWFKSMADDSALKTITNGTISLVSSDAITPRANGFTLGLDTNVNIADELVYWEAHE